MPLARDLERLRHLRVLSVAQIVEVQQLPNLLQGEAEPLAAQDQLQASPIAFGVEALLTDADRTQQLLRLVEPERAGRDLEGVAHLSDRHRLLCHVFPRIENSFPSGFPVPRQADADP